MTKRVAVCGCEASRGWWEPGCEAGSEAHFEDAALKLE
ncbi:hypothetical protein KP77_33860 [Jeotgalibacillus alimentarius]|uniref:Uncharacterized protein n=1 Tax=Jeotgalibacillus alimentarius TaxID=135826 RepID=A0A0C2VDX3_9BACL|nr:hypothetical protein KP77_33860 [Jeotgalibacillus alimentarius]